MFYFPVPRAVVVLGGIPLVIDNFLSGCLLPGFSLVDNAVSAACYMTLMESLILAQDERWRRA